MGFIPEITCRHCGKKFSAIHRRCPHCGAQRVKNSGKLPPKVAANADTGTVQREKKTSGVAASLFRSNTKWQFMFGCILIVLVIVAVIVLISASLGKNAKEPIETPPIPSAEVTTPPPTTPPPTPSPEPTVPVTSIGLTFLGSPIKEFTQRIGSADIQLKAEIYPVEAVATAKVEWRSSDDSIVKVDQTGLCTAVGSGWAEIIAECGGVAASCKVWVP